MNNDRRISLTEFRTMSNTLFDAQLSEKESEKLISDLEKTEVPWDPHGRPAVVKLEFDKLSRQFGR